MVGPDSTATRRYKFAYSDQTAYAETASLIRSHFTAGDVVVDVGCGFGALGEICQQQGLTYVGLDANAAGLKDLAERGFEVHEVFVEGSETFLERVRAIIGDRRLAGFLLLDVLEHLVDAEDVLRILRTVAGAYDSAPVVMCVPNVTHFDVGAKLLQGRWDQTDVGILDDTHVGFYSEDLLGRLTRRVGWCEIARADFRLDKSDQHFPSDNVALSSGTPLNSLLRHVRTQSSPGADVCQFVRVYVPGPVSSAESAPRNEVETTYPAPFLTVLTRTQGTRLDTLQETLLCLAGQTDQDFEVLLLAHNVSPEQADNIRYLIDTLSHAISWRFRLVPVTGPGRCRPLNVGVEAARGQYVAVLDDDDLVLGNWVGTFKHLAQQWPGRVLRAVAAEQDIARGPWPDRDGYVPLSAITTPYPSEFDLFDHIVENHSPPCGLAFPRSCFRDLGVRFDESLPVLEDWDVLLQTSLLCGVASSDEVTSIYRRWKVGPSSTSIHTSAEWDGAHQAVIAKLDRFASLFPGGSMTRIRELQSDRLVAARLKAVVEEQERKLASLSAQLDAANAAVVREVASVRADFVSSTSWKLTRPFRVASRAAQRMAERHRS